jgi:hypothetical protein
VQGRCRATNLCAYCARLAAVENAEMLALDALHGVAPVMWLCLGTRTASGETRPFYRAREKLLKALRRRWPETQAACLVEFTTGYAPTAGGERRPHWNVLLKGIPAAWLDEVREIARRVWCAHVDALPEYQHGAPVNEAGGLMRYLALHFLKESQAPPKGWRGHRLTLTRGYLWRPTAEARQEARAALRLKRELWRAFGQGLEGEAAQEAAEMALLAAGALTWKFVNVSGEAEPLSDAQRAASALRGVRALKRKPDAYFLAELRRWQLEQGAPS